MSPWVCGSMRSSCLTWLAVEKEITSLSLSPLLMLFINWTPCAIKIATATVTFREMREWVSEWVSEKQSGFCSSCSRSAVNYSCLLDDEIRSSLPTGRNTRPGNLNTLFVTLDEQVSHECHLKYSAGVLLLIFIPICSLSLSLSPSTGKSIFLSNPLWNAFALVIEMMQSQEIVGSNFS